MLLTKLITKVAIIRKVSFSKFNAHLVQLKDMSEVNGIVKKPKYDGRTKKRKWEERRSDYTSDSKRPTGEIFERVKKRKFALLMGYSGVNYYGMQRNPQMITIEEELLKALLKCNYITEDSYNHVQNMQFQRAARTDKGVSAARQIVSLKLPEATEVASINEHLPETIRVFGVKRVTKGFNSKSQCDARTYMYMLPTVAFAHHEEEVKQDNYRLSDEILDKINTYLSKFVGTKNFHNYTIKKKYQDPSASRYIMSFICEKPFLSNGIEFVALKVKGQSFMMHQIRKMVGIILALIRGHTSEEVFDKTFLNEKVNVPKAPGLGLVLDFVHYDRYNYRYGSDHDTLEWKDEESIVNEFKEKFIYPTIVDTESKDQSMVQWLEVLNIHNYDVIEEDNEVNNGGDDDDDGCNVDDQCNDNKEESTNKES